MTIFFRSLVLTATLVLSSFFAKSQLVSNNAFLKGNYVEVGIAPCGSFGSSVNAPTGYHPRGTGNSSGANQLGFVANVAKNNWASYVGDYFLPGTPEEGWGVTVNGVSYNNNLICALGSSQIQGNFISYESNASQTAATWQGNIAGLSITARTYIPLNSLYFITEVTVQNTSASKVDNIFYMRNVDPDHGVLTPGAGGSYNTTNSIVYQTPNSCNQALVSAVTLAGNNYLGLGSIDSRARVTHGGFSNRSAADIWNGTGFSTSGTVVGDRAISVSFNIGSLNPNQSTKFAYAYILDAAQLTQALAATNINLALDGVNYSTGNTTNICSGTAVPITLSNTGTYNTWTWTPSTGLNTTTGTSVIATLTSPITYTATGVGTCGTTSVNITLNPVIQSTPGNAGSITGLSVIGLGQNSVTYSIPQVANATYYTWTLPPGAVVTSAKSDSNVITFNAPSTTWCGDISVQPKNSCGVGASSSLGVCISNIATGSVASPICAGATGTLPISTPLGFFLSGNVFTAQLSNASGSFANPVNIGSVSGTSSSFINYTIPLNTPSGTGYRIRTISSSPATIGTDNGSNLTINAAETPSIQINASQTVVCSGTSITFTSTITSGGTSPIYQWKLNGVNVSTSSSYTLASPVVGDQVSCILTSNVTCATTTTATSNTITLTSGTGTPSIVITSNRSSICAGTAVTFTAVATNGGTTPVYQWKKNGNNVGTNSNTYTDNTIVTSDVISCVLTSNATCASSTTATSNSLSITVNANLTPSISISASQTSICSGSNATITFTATATNGGSSPIYQWKKNGVNVGDNSSTYSTNTIGGTDVITCVLTSNATCLTTTTATSNPITIAITPSVIPEITISASQTTICTGSPTPTITFTATQTGGGSSPTYQWRKNGVNVGTNSATYSDNSFVNGTQISCVLTSNDPSPCLTSQTDTSDVITIIITSPATPSISISGSTSICSGIATTYTATIFNGGTTPSYQWKKNGINVGTDAGTYTDNTLVSGDQISCVLTSSAPCTTTPTATSNSITVTVTPSVTPSVTISSSQTVLCTGTSATITLRATTSNGGLSPTYQWKKNGVVVLTTTSNTYTVLAAVGDVFSVIVNSSATCSSPLSVESTSLTITSTASVIPTLFISTPTTSVCSGNTVVFTAISNNGGTAPTFQWYRNGVLAQSSTINTYSSASFANGDVISCTMTSNLTCASPTSVNSSNTITLSVSNSITPSISISASQTTICTGGSITFTATAVNAGVGATYQWFKNGLAVGTNSVIYTDNALTNGSYIYCRLTNNSSTCLTTNNVFSNQIFITVSSGLVPSIYIYSSSSSSCAGTSVTFTAVPTNGGTSPSYQWKKNGNNVGTNSITYTDNTLTSTDIITCVLTSNAACLTTPTATSTGVSVSITPNTPLSLTISASQTIICTGTTPTITYTATPNSSSSSVYKYYYWRRNGVIVSTNASYGVVSYSTSANSVGDIFTCEIYSSDASCVSPAYPIVSSNSIQLTSATSVTPTISIAASTSSSICTGGFVTVIATTTNAGSSPTYQWRRNGTIIATTFSPSYTFNTLSNNDLITCTLASSLTCATGTVLSNSISITVTASVTPSVTISASQTNVCAGTYITFTATPVNGGTTPTYSWTKNGVALGINTSTFTSNNFASGDAIRCVLTSSLPCVTSAAATSTPINLVITGSVPSVSISTANTSLCDGSNTATFTATPTNGGTNPVYQWKKNGVNVGTNSASYTDNAISNNDTIICFLTSDVACPATVFSNKIGMKIITITTPTVNGPIAINCGQAATLTAVPGSGNNIRWFTSLTGGSNIGTGNSLVVSPTVSTTYYAEAYSNATNSSTNSINTSGATGVDAYNLAGTSSSGIAFSPNYVYMNGSNYTVRYNKSDLTGGTRLPLRSKYFCDLSNGNLWQLGDNTSNGGSFTNGVVTRIYRLDEGMVPTGSFVTLSQTFTVATQYTIIAAGEGYVLVHDYYSYVTRRIDLSTGLVTVYNTISTYISHNSNGEAYGWSEFDGTNYFMFYRLFNEIRKINLTTGLISTFQTFTNLGDNNLVNILVEPQASRMYFHSGGNSQYLTGLIVPLGFVGINNVLSSIGCTNPTRVPVQVTVTPITPTITPSGATTICSTGSLTLTASTGTTYQWTKDGNNISGATGQNYSPTSSGNYAVIVTTSSGCVSTSLATSVTVNTPVTPTISITANQTTICSGTTITFTATAVNGGVSPAYQWKKNGNNVGTNSNTYTDNTLANGDIVTCVLTSNQTCITVNTATSNAVTLTVSSASPSVSIIASQTNICTGVSVAFTATAVNGGTSPTYQWKKNGVNVGTNNNTYVDNSLVNNDQVTCVITSNAACATTTTASSNVIIISVTPISTPSISISTASTTICSGSSITFTATALAGGSSPIYQWKRNGLNVGTNSPTFTTSTLANNDVISCVLTSNLPCVTSTSATSNNIVLTVTNTVTPSVSISATSTIICAGTSVTFTATPTNGGTTPTYQWKKNGVNVGTNSSTYTDNTLVNGNQINCVVTSNAACVTATTATSNIITMSVTATVTPTISITTSTTTVCAGGTPFISASTINGGSSPSYQWFKNGVAISGEVNSYIYAYGLVTGDIITCRLSSNATCTSSATVTSNSLTFTVLPNLASSITISTPQTSICAGSTLTITANAVNMGTGLSYLWYKNGLFVSSSSTPTYTTATINTGDYFQCIASSAAPCNLGSYIYSNFLTITVIPQATVSISASQTAICDGSNTSIFTATANNAGVSPTYQWKKNGVNVGTNSATYTDNALVNNDAISCVVTASGTCTSTATSNVIIISIVSIASPTVSSPISITCGGSATLSATVGSGVLVRWFTTPSGGSAFALGNSTNVSPNTTTTYYAEAYTTAGCVALGRTPIIVNVSVGTAPTITASGSTTFCSSSSLTLTASAGATYQWLRNGVNISGAVSQTYAPTQSGSYSVFVTSSNGCSNVSSATNVTVNTPVTPTISILANQTTICASTPITFTATVTNAGSSPAYQWKVNGFNVGTNSPTYTDNALLSGDNVTCVLTSNATCITTAIVTSNIVSMTVSSAVPSISIAASQNNICSGTSVTFTATAVNGGSNPIYQWKKNGSNVGANISTYTDNTLVSSDVISCQLTSNATCAATSSVTSNNLSVLVNTAVTPTISISASQSSICSGTSVTFTAVITNGGGAPVYQWKKNGINVGTNSSSYSDALLNSNDVITCQLNSNATCATVNSVTSSPITITVNPAINPSIAITTTSTTICSGNSLTFTAISANAGASPIYQWKKNGINVGTNSATYTDNALTNGNTITCTLTSNESCATPTSVVSNTITVTVNSVVAPTISIFASSNPICSGNSVTFSSSITNGGTSPTFQWRVNGVNVGGNSTTYSTNSLSSGDVVSCVLLSNRTCLSTSSVTSNNIVMTVNSSVTPSITLTSSTTTACSGSAVVFTASPVNQGTSPSYSWYVNGNYYSNTSSPTLTYPSITSAIAVYCTLYNGSSCVTTNYANSNVVNVSTTTTLTPTITVYTPTTSITAGTNVTFTAIPTNGGSTPSYQWKRNGVNVGTNSATYSSNTLVNGDVISCVLTSNAICLTATTATSNNVTMVVSSNFFVRGNVVNPNNLPIPNVIVKVNATDSVFTPADGTYNFNLPASGSYNITASKNNDVVKSSGINVLDVLLIQRHIAGTVLLNTPYKIIAADVDNSSTINIFDLIRTKRLILGTDTTFPGNRLWAFVDSAYTFPDPTNPISYKDSIKINSLASNQVNQTFIGVKLGDVNLDLIPTVGVNRISRVGLPVILYHDTIITSISDKKVRIDIKSKNFKDLLGIQFTLAFNRNQFTFAGIENKNLPIEYGVSKANNGEISFIWSDSINAARTLNDDSVLFTLILNKQDIIGSETIHINSLITEALAYDNNYAAHDVIKGNGIILGNKLELVTNESMSISPNPTSGWVKIKITSVENKTVTLLLADMLGKQVMQKTIGLVKGDNEFMLNVNEPKPLAHATYFLKVLGLKGKDIQPVIIGK